MLEDILVGLDIEDKVITTVIDGHEAEGDENEDEEDGVKMMNSSSAELIIFGQANYLGYLP